MDKEGKVVGGRTSNNETASWNLVAEKKEDGILREKRMFE